jgi:hypothetical protein
MWNRSQATNAKQFGNGCYKAAARKQKQMKGVFCAVRAGGCARNNEYSKRNGVFCAVRA